MKRLWMILFLCSLFVTGCGNSGEDKPTDSAKETTSVKEEAVISFTDDRGTKFSIAAPERVAVLIGSFADIWCVAGGKDSLVAAANDSWTSFELELDDSVVNLGAIKEPNVELLLASQPDFVIGSVNTAADLELEPTLTQAGIPIAYFDVQNFSDYLRMLAICTKLTGDTEAYQTYGVDIQTQIDAILARQDDSHPTVLCLRATGVSCKVKGSRDNVLGEMLADLGCINVADSETSLLEDLSMEAILAADPDYIFAVLQGSDDTKASEMLKKTLLDNPAWGSLRAVKEEHFYTMEHRLFNLKPNAQWGIAYEKLADLLYPEQ